MHRRRSRARGNPATARHASIDRKGRHSWQNPRIVTVTGAAGNIGYALLFRIASGSCSARTFPSSQNLLGDPQGCRRRGTAMEPDDCASRTPAGVEIFAFQGTNVAYLVGCRAAPQAGMERADLLEANAGILGPQGAPSTTALPMTCVSSSWVTPRTPTRHHRPHAGCPRPALLHRDDSTTTGAIASSPKTGAANADIKDAVVKPLGRPVPGRLSRRRCRQARDRAGGRRVAVQLLLSHRLPWCRHHEARGGFLFRCERRDDRCTPDSLRHPRGRVVTAVSCPHYGVPAGLESLGFPCHL